MLTTARRRLVDRLRAEAVAARKVPLLVVDAEATEADSQPRAHPGDSPVVGDETLRLVLLCCHPALSLESSSALALRLVVGLPVAHIARLFLAQESAVAARVTRAKRKIAAAGMPFTMPGADRLAERVDRVADVAYLAFTAGYVPGPGPDLFRADLAGEAIRLVRLTRELAGPLPLLDIQLALMMLQHSRREARVTADGTSLVLLRGPFALAPGRDRRGPRAAHPLRGTPSAGRGGRPPPGGPHRRRAQHRCHR